MDQDIRMRLKWVELFVSTGNSGLTCLRCGISRPTLRKWWTRYQLEGLEGLRSKSRKPNSSPAQKVFGQQKHRILSMRKDRNLGARRIQNELLRLHETHLGLATMQKVLTRSGVAPLSRGSARIRPGTAIPARCQVIGSRWTPAKSLPEFINIPP